MADTTNLAADGTTVISPGFNAFAPVPEPGTLAIFGAGLAMLGVMRRKRKAN